MSDVTAGKDVVAEARAEGEKTAAALKAARATADAKQKTTPRATTRKAEPVAEPTTPPSGTSGVSIVSRHEHGLTVEQYTALLAPVSTGRVQQRDGHSHLEVWDVRRYLDRIFGFTGWGNEARTVLVSERDTTNKAGAPAITVVYTAEVTLHVRCRCGAPLTSWTDAASGDAVNFSPNKIGDAHSFAVKSAVSNALKRAAVNLGDQFGLSLYEPTIKPGQTAVTSTLAAPEGYGETGTLPQTDQVTAGEDPEPPTGTNTEMGPSTEDAAYKDGYDTGKMHAGSMNVTVNPGAISVNGNPPVPVAVAVPVLPPGADPQAGWDIARGAVLPTAAREAAMANPVHGAPAMMNAHDVGLLKPCPWPDAPYQDQHVWVDPDGQSWMCPGDHSEARAVDGQTLQDGAMAAVRQSFPEAQQIEPAPVPTPGPAPMPPAPAQQADGGSPRAVQVNALRQIIAGVPSTAGLKAIYGSVANEWGAYTTGEQELLRQYVDAAYFRITGSQRPALPDQWAS